MTQQERNYNTYLKINEEEYTNKWIAIVDGQVVSAKDHLKEVCEETQKKFPKKQPLIAKILQRKVMIYNQS